MTGPGGRGVAGRVGAVGVYTSGAGVELVRQARAVAGAVTVAGTSGRKAICALAAAGDLHGVDLDPAVYLERNTSPAQGSLFDLDWELWQRDRRLPVVRSAGTYVRSRDTVALAAAFDAVIGAGTVRVVSMDGWWLHSGLGLLLERVGDCEDALGFVLAGYFDPLDEPRGVAGLRQLADLAAAGGRRVELLRTDLAAIGFAAVGGTLGTIGTNTSMRHHGLPPSREAARSYHDRQHSPYVFVPALLGWHRGDVLGALTSFDGAGITRCDCPVCDGDDLLRFDQTWPGLPPVEVRRAAQAHDLHCCAALARSVLSSAYPAAAWARECRSAVQVAEGIKLTYRVELPVPNAIKAWQ